MRPIGPRHPRPRARPEGRLSHPRGRVERSSTLRVKGSSGPQERRATSPVSASITGKSRMSEHAVKNEPSDLSLLPLPELEAELCRRGPGPTQLEAPTASPAGRVRRSQRLGPARRNLVHRVVGRGLRDRTQHRTRTAPGRSSARCAPGARPGRSRGHACPTPRPKSSPGSPTPDTIDELVELAAPCPAGRLGVILAAWQQRHDSADSISAAQFDARHVSWRTEPDGMTTFTVRLPPIDAGRRPGWRRHPGHADHRAHGRVPRPVSSRRHSSSSSRRGGGVGAEVLVHVARTKDGALVAALPDGTPVPDPQVSQLLCESTVRALVHDSDGAPIDASPARPAPTKRQLRLLHERDQHCRYPGCTARQFLHAHHVIHREHGGPTIVANLILLCSFHHRLVHEVAGPGMGRRRRRWPIPFGEIRALIRGLRGATHSQSGCFL